MLVALGLLLYNISPSENVAAYLASIRPTNASSALQYHYNAVLALNHLLTGRLRRASAYAARARRMTADQGMASYIYILQGCIAIRQGDYGRAVALLDDAASTAPAGRMSALIAFYRGIVLFEKRAYSSAIRCFECAGDSTADPLDKVVVHNNIGSCAMYLGDMRRAEEEFLAMEQLAWHLNRHLARKCLLTVSSYIGALSRARRENAKAIERYENSLKIAVSTGDGKLIANQTGNLGVAYASAGATAKAVQLLNSCMAYSERIGYWAGIRFACWHICHTLAGAGQRTEARRFHDSYAARYPELRYLRY
jgi:tetratricopeptide (TPR) repeat protein